jgi:Skp family chaperone for outer membrane proteins
MKKIGMAAVCYAQNIAVVNMEDLVTNHPNTISDKKLLAELVKEDKQKGDDLQRKLESMNDDFEKARREALDPALNDKARKTAEENVSRSRDALMKADHEAREKMQQLQQELSEQQTRMLKRTTAEIREVVAKHAAEKKITLVLPDNQAVYFDKTLDITDDIMKALNIHRPEKTESVKDNASEKLALPPTSAKDAGKGMADKAPATGAAK